MKIIITAQRVNNMESTFDYNVNSAGCLNCDCPPYDMHCPQVGDKDETKLNFWKKRCLERQQEPMAEHCYGGCKAKKKTVKPKAPMSREMTEMIVRMREQGMTVKDIAKIANRSQSVISNKLHKEKQKKKGRRVKWSDDLLIEILKLKRKGWTYLEMSNHFDSTPDSVRHAYIRAKKKEEENALQRSKI
jgi:transcriptional regulator